MTTKNTQAASEPVLSPQHAPSPRLAQASMAAVNGPSEWIRHSTYACVVNLHDKCGGIVYHTTGEPDEPCQCPHHAEQAEAATPIERFEQAEQRVNEWVQTEGADILKAASVQEWERKQAEDASERDWADEEAAALLPCYCGGDHLIIGHFNVDPVNETETFERYDEPKKHTGECPVELRASVAQALRRARQSPIATMPAQPQLPHSSYEKVLDGVCGLGYADCSLVEFARGLKYFIESESRNPNCDTHLIAVLQRAACVGWELSRKGNEPIARPPIAEIDPASLSAERCARTLTSVDDVSWIVRGNAIQRGGFIVPLEIAQMAAAYYLSHRAGKDGGR